MNTFRENSNIDEGHKDRVSWVDFGVNVQSLLVAGYLEQNICYHVTVCTPKRTKQTLRQYDKPVTSFTLRECKGCWTSIKFLKVINGG